LVRNFGHDKTEKKGGNSKRNLSHLKGERKRCTPRDRDVIVKKRGGNNAFYCCRDSEVWGGKRKGNGGGKGWNSCINSVTARSGKEKPRSLHLGETPKKGKKKKKTQHPPPPKQRKGGGGEKIVLPPFCNHSKGEEMGYQALLIL